MGNTSLRRLADLLKTLSESSADILPIAPDGADEPKHVDEWIARNDPRQSLQEIASLCQQHGLTGAAERFQQLNARLTDLYLRRIGLFQLAQNESPKGIAALQAQYGPFPKPTGEPAADQEHLGVTYDAVIGAVSQLGEYADELRQTIDRQLTAPEKSHANESETSADRLLNIKEAAALLGYDPPGLRKLAKQGRIQFLQNGQGPLRFKREWLNDFIAANATRADGKAKKRTSRQPPAAEPRLGFDPALYSK